MPPSAPESRYRRRVLGVGGAAAFLLYVIGAPIFNNRIEDDLERRVPAALMAAGFGDVDAKFSGQEGRLSCAAPLADPEGTLAVAHEVRGVYSVELDRGCRVNTAPGDSDGAATDTTPDNGSGGPATSAPDFATVGAVIEGDPQFSALARLAGESDLAARLGDERGEPVTVFAPTGSAFENLPAAVIGRLDDDAEVRRVVARRHVVVGALDREALAALAGTTLTTLDGDVLAVAVEGDTITLEGANVGEPIDTPNGVVYPIDRVLVPAELEVAATGAVVTATLSEGMLTVNGPAADEAASSILILAATAAAGDRFQNELTIDPATGLDAEPAGQLATLITALGAELVSGAAGYDGTGLYLSGAFANAADAARAEAAAAAVGAVTDLRSRPNATAAQATALEAALNEFVSSNPITFEQGSAVLDESAIAIIDRLAARLVEYGGLTVVVEGHTDSDGSPTTNQALSEQRAGSVRQALIDRGVDPATITSEGFGSQQPVLGANGIEDKTASRRVEFRITAG